MTRLIPGRRNYDGGIAIPLVCSGGCHQGRLPCDCELSCDIAPDADRVIAPPPPLPDDVRSHLRRRALFLSALCFALMAALLELFGAQPFDRINP